MTPEEITEILKSIRDSWKADDEYQFKKYKSNIVMHSANQILQIPNLGIEDKISQMNHVAREHGFESIKDVLIFRGTYIKPS